jgi:CubicO group peptidase (beta-lactamase class C family)
MTASYTKNAETGILEPVPPMAGFGSPDRPPQRHEGLYSTAGDYARFCQMLLGGGQREGLVCLSPEAVRWMSTPLTGELPTGFLHGEKQAL